MFGDCIRLKDIKTHAKRFCYQYSNLISHEKFMSFLGFLSKTNVLEKKNDVFYNCSI
jgi:hypothetical protein